MGIHKRLMVSFFSAAAVMSILICAHAEISREDLEAAGPDGVVRFISGIISGDTPGHSVDIEVELWDQEYLWLVVTDGGDGYAFDHSNWLNARLSGPAGERCLSQEYWLYAVTGYGEVNKNRAVSGRELKVKGQVYERGIGTHSPSVILFRIPEGYNRFHARGALDDHGVSRGPATVQFAVLTGKPSPAQARMLGQRPWPDIDHLLAREKDEREWRKRNERLAELTRDRTDEVMREFAGVDEKLRWRGREDTFLRGIPGPEARAEQTFNKQALLWDSDRDPVDVALRRTRALWRDLSAKVDLSSQDERLIALEKRGEEVNVADLDGRLQLFREIVALRREIAFSNPLLEGMDEILFITRDALPFNEFQGGNHMCDQYFGFHATRRGQSRGTGLFVLEDPFSDNPTVRNVLENSTVENGWRKGRSLDGGGFLSPALSYDGKEILFAWTEGMSQGPHWRVWDKNTVFHIFKVNVDGSNLVQLTDGLWNEFDPCWLPNGRIAFISERRGGYGRCHGRPVPSFTLHSMHDDGSDIVTLSPHETNEWQPSVDNNGMIIYTRWDYVDRGFNQAHHIWITYPDGRDSRAISGNYRTSERVGPHMQMNVRAIPGSPLYAAIAAGHHTEARGSVILIDPRIPDDNAMAQMKRVTPDQLFPESEFMRQRASGSYATPWPLSENYYLCVYERDANNQYRDVDESSRRYAITLLDAFGNKEILYQNPDISTLSPMPLQARPVPPVIPHGTLIGRPREPDGSKPEVSTASELPSTATVGALNVYESRFPMPEGTRITHLRIWQILPKTTPNADHPNIGYGAQKGAKACLGTVPVEEDGSAYWQQPVGIPFLMHALDENGVAVQGMRSVTYVQPGERLVCSGCHESREQAAVRPSFPKAFAREPSVITPEPEGTRPFSYPRLVQPVLDRHCVECHTQNAGNRAPDLSPGDYHTNPHHWYTSFINLRPYVFFHDDPAWTEPSTFPGRFGARRSRLYEMLVKGHHDVELPPEDFRRLVIWMDSNGLFFGHEDDIAAQAAGEVVWPSLE